MCLSHRRVLHCNKLHVLLLCNVLHQQKLPASVWFFHDLQFSHFSPLPPTPSSHHNSFSNHSILQRRLQYAFSLQLLNHGAVKLFMWSAWICAVQQSLHSAAGELFNHGMVYTAKLLRSLLPLTPPPLSAVCFIHQRQHNPFETIATEMQKNAAMSITGLETKTVQRETLCERGPWPVLLQPNGEQSRPGFLDEAAAEESRIKHFRLDHECTQSARE